MLDLVHGHAPVQSFTDFSGGRFKMKTANTQKYAELYAHIKNCRKCHGNQPPNGARPFHYAPEPKSLTSQTKVMLLTLRPSFQALNRPLVSTRFFRALALSLFGPNPQFTEAIPTYFDVFKCGEVYWTHYHKCYIKQSEIPFEDTPTTCFDIFFQRELDAVSPSLLIILGNPLIQKLFGTTDRQRIPTKYHGVECLCADFPKTGAEPEFVTIRKRLQPLLQQISVDPAEVPARFILQSHTGAPDSMRRHADFELECLDMYCKLIKDSVSTSNDTGTIDDRFCFQEVIPRWNRYNFIVLCSSFIEDQLKTALPDSSLTAAPRRGRRWPILRELLCEYSRNYRNIDAELEKDILALAKIRNTIAHCGGIAYPENALSAPVEDALKRLGMRKFNDMIEIGPIECETALCIIKRFVEVLI